MFIKCRSRSRRPRTTLAGEREQNDEATDINNAPGLRIWSRRRTVGCVNRGGLRNSGYREIDRKMAITQAVNSRCRVVSVDGRRQFEHCAAQVIIV